MDLVREILTEPRCWRIMANDAVPTPDHFAPNLSDRLVYYIARDKGRTLAVFVLVLMAPGTAEVHFCFLPEAWGRATTIKTGTAFIEWIWKHTSLNWLLGPVPSHNRLAMTLAKACGFTLFAEERGAVTKRGKKYNNVILQVKRPSHA